MVITKRKMVSQGGTALTIKNRFTGIIQVFQKNTHEEFVFGMVICRYLYREYTCTSQYMYIRVMLRVERWVGPRQSLCNDPLAFLAHPPVLLPPLLIDWLIDWCAYFPGTQSITVINQVCHMSGYLSLRLINHCMLLTILNDLILVRHLSCIYWQIWQLYVHCSLPHIAHIPPVRLSIDTIGTSLPGPTPETVNYVRVLKRNFVRITQYCGLQNMSRVFL